MDGNEFVLVNEFMFIRIVEIYVIYLLNEIFNFDVYFLMCICMLKGISFLYSYLCIFYNLKIFILMYFLIIRIKKLKLSMRECNILCISIMYMYVNVVIV